MCVGTTQTASGTHTFRLAGIVDESIVDGPGLRTTVFFQGCTHHCPGCHNPETHDFGGGTETTVGAVYDHVKAQTLCYGVTFSGGDPFNQPKALELLTHRLHDDGYHICIYTGYTYDYLKVDRLAMSILQHTDLLVDGPYIEAQRSLELQFRGSANQRLIDIRTMRAHDDMDTLIYWNEHGRIYR